MENYVYKVRESIIVIILGIIILVAGLVCVGVGFMISPENGRSVCFVVGAIITALGLVFVYEYNRRALIVIEEGREYIYRPFIGPSKHFYKSDVAKTEIRPVKLSPQDECIVVYDYDGKKIVGLEMNMVNADRFAKEISRKEVYEASLHEEKKNPFGSYFKEDDDLDLIPESEKELRRRKIAKIQTANYVLGTVILLSALASLFLGRKMFCIIFMAVSLVSWVFFLAMRNYMVFEHNKNATYDKTLFASAEFPVWTLAVVSLLGLNKIFVGIHYVDSTNLVFEILGFTLLMVLLFAILPKDRKYKFYFYILIFFVSGFNGWLLAESFSYYTAEVTSVEEIEVTHTRKEYHRKRGYDYYITIDSDTFNNKEIEVTEAIYDKARIGHTAGMELYFAEDLLGSEFYYIQYE